MKVRIRQAPGRTVYVLWCPACDDAHHIDNTWTFNDDTDKPTFTPSILGEIVFTDGRRHVCHSYVTDGVWNYLGDCTHNLAGQSVPLPDLPDWA